jgi:hypothetical protein
MSPVSLFFVTTSAFGQWVICVPAAFLRSGSRFSMLPLRNQTLIPRYPSKPLWASMPQSTVDRAHDRWRCRRRQAVRSAQSYSESPGGRPRPFGFDLIKAPFTRKGSGTFARISSRITAVIRVKETIQYISCDIMSHSRISPYSGMDS